jgi:hypothetical protein
MFGNTTEETAWHCNEVTWSNAGQDQDYDDDAMASQANVRSNF